MEVRCSSNRIHKICSSREKARKKHGKKTADLLMKRLAEFRAARNLSDIKDLGKAGDKPRLHRLKGKRKGELAVDLDDPKRLIIEPYEYDKKEIIFNDVEIVTIKEITDYH